MLEILLLPNLSFEVAVEASARLWAIYAVLATIELEYVCSHTRYQHFMRTGFGSAGSLVAGGPGVTTFERAGTRRLGLLIRGGIAAALLIRPSLVWLPLAGPIALGVVVLLNHWVSRGMWLAREGSDEIGKATALCLFLTIALPDSGRLVGPYLLMAQLLLSYFVAGIIKLVDPSWRSGNAITGVLNTYSYGHPTAARLLGGRFASSFLGLCTVAWELTTPLIFVAPKWLIVPFFAIGAMFHVGNMIIMRIGAFCLGFIATYPLVLWALFDLRGRLGVHW
ncbi:MAG: hypothetical protein ACI81R_002618 [Bradymonadia bacterium]|jgi:hypothetical protein